MQKILTLSEKNWLSGMCLSDDTLLGGGIFISAPGFDISENPGWLMGGRTPTDIGGATVTDDIKYFVLQTKAGSNFAYACGSNGEIYKINTATDAVSKISSSLNITSSIGNGINIFKDYLIYIKNTEVRKYGPLSGTPVDSSVDTALQQPAEGTFDHPSIVMPNQKIYIGDFDESTDKEAEIDSYDGTTYVHNVLNLDYDSKMIGLETDGYHLIILTSNNPLNPGLKGKSQVVFWDTRSPNPNKIYPIPGGMTASAILRNPYSNTFLLFTQRGIYETAFGMPPRPFFLEQLSSSNTYTFNPKPGGVDWWKGNPIWGITSDVFCYGQPARNMPKAFWNPFTAIGSAIQSLKTIDITKVYVGSSTNKLYAIKSGQTSGILATTPFIDLKRPYKLEMIKLITSKLASGQSVQVTAKEFSNLNNILSDTFSFANYGAENIGKLYGKGTTATRDIAEQIQLSLTLTGNVKVKRLELWGTPTEEI